MTTSRWYVRVRETSTRDLYLIECVDKITFRHDWTSKRSEATTFTSQDAALAARERWSSSLGLTRVVGDVVEVMTPDEQDEASCTVDLLKAQRWYVRHTCGVYLREKRAGVPAFTPVTSNQYDWTKERSTATVFDSSDAAREARGRWQDKTRATEVETLQLKILRVWRKPRRPSDEEAKKRQTAQWIASNALYGKFAKGSARTRRWSLGEALSKAPHIVSRHPCPADLNHYDKVSAYPEAFYGGRFELPHLSPDMIAILRKANEDAQNDLRRVVAERDVLREKVQGLRERLKEQMKKT